MKKGKITKGKLLGEATELLKGAKALEKAGADLMILEKIPEKLSRIITRNVTMPTIGIGAGKYCDGQVLIILDLFGINERKFKHNPEYVNLRQVMIDTIRRYRKEIDEGIFPGRMHSNLIDESEYARIADWCSRNDMVV